MTKSKSSSTKLHVKSNRSHPLPVQNINNFSIPNHFIQSNPPSRLFVCGSGDCAQLGLTDDVIELRKPTLLTKLPGLSTDISAGGLHNLVITQSNVIYSWGCNDQNALGRQGDEYIPESIDFFDQDQKEQIVSVFCGDSISCALTRKGQLYIWGTFRDSNGILGFSNKIKIQKTPTLVNFKEKNVFIVKAACGVDHVVALTNKGKVYTWGNGEQYQLGRKILSRHKLNGLIPQLTGLRNIVDIACGSYHTIALTKDGKVYGFGLNNYGQLTSLSNKHISNEIIQVPTRIKQLELKDIKQITCGEHFTLILKQNGQVYGVGRCDGSQLGLTKEKIKEYGITGDNKNIYRAVPQPVRIDGLDDIIKINSGSNHSIAIDKNKVAYSFGFGETFALGNGTGQDNIIPTKIQSSENIIDAKCGAQHSLFLME